MADLSAYELKRSEKIRQNNAHLLSLGLGPDATALKPKPKPKPAPKPKAAPSGPARRSSRLDGMPPEDVGVEPEAAQKPPDKADRDELACWWTATEENPAGEKRPPLTDAQFKALETPLTTEQRESIVPEDNVNLMVEDALRFLRCYGGQLPQPYCVPSRPNFKKVLGFAVRLRVSG